MRRKFDRSLCGVLLLGVVIVGVVVTGALGSTRRTAAPVAQTIGRAVRDTKSTANRGPVATHPGAAKPVRVNVKPHELFLRRAHGAVFSVKRLKSVVVKRERPEHEDPLGPSVDMPSTLTEQQMVKTTSASPAAMPSADSSFDGLDFANWGGGHPPDENGDVGPNYYIQTVNTSIGIYDKSNGNRVAAFTFNSFMSQGQFGNLCDTNNFGDPVVLYDSYENRWMITDFAFTLAGGAVSPQTVYQCFAVSKTGDPVNGGWNFYSILDPGGLGDYPKFGVWPDGIYMSANMFDYAANGGYQGYHVWALNKQQMYAGAPQVSVVDFAGDTSDFTVIPANSKLAAGAPPAGSPEFFVSTWNYLNALAIYKFHVNWDKISTSTFKGPFTELAPNCWPNATPANASTPANAADVLPLRAMAAPQYTNQGGVESLWVAHTVQRGVSADNATCNATTGGNATVRWYQANVTGGTIATNLTQGSSFDPEAANTFYRFQPALAVDRSGDMAVTYTESNASTNPSIMYDGRLAGDPANTLGTENTLFAGTGAQSGNCGTSTCVRWGDYAGMELDPDGCEFWMTGEYYATNGLNDLTRIGSFRFPGCTPVGNGTLSGIVTDGTNPISGATVTLGSRTTTTDSNGAYSFTVPAGTYLSLTADSPGYTEGSASSLAVPDGSTLTHNFTLSAAAQSGCITDNSKSLFQRGVPSSTCDLTSSPGNVILSNSATVDQQSTAGTTIGYPFGTPAWAGETFTEGVTGQLISVDFTVYCSSCTSNPNLAVSIRATSGGVPTGADLASTTIPGNTSGSIVTLTATFNSSPTLTAGTQYALIVHPVSSPGGNGYFWIRSTPSTYAGGSRVSSPDNGVTWSADTTRDFNFDTYVSATGYAPSATFVSSLRDANPVAGSTPHWTTFSFTATKPASTSVTFQVAGSNSPYGPWNYVGPDGTASTFFTRSGADLSEFNGDRYLQYKAFLSTSDSGVTPALSSVSTCFQDVTPATVATTLTPSDATGAYGGTTTLTATLTDGANGVANESVEFTLNGSDVGGATTNANGVAEIDNVSLSGIDPGSYPSYVGASFPGDSNYLTSSGSSSLTVSKADQSITFATPADRTYGDADFDPGATASSGDPVSYDASGACSIVSGKVHLAGAGSCQITASQPGDANYNPAPQVQRTFAINKAGQSITFATPADRTYGDPNFDPGATASSGLAVSYGASGACSIVGGMVHLTGAGSCSVTASQAGNANYNAAQQVQHSFSINKADQSITFATPANRKYGDPNFDPGATGSSGLAVSYSASGACSIVSGKVHLTRAGSCSVTAGQGGNANYNAAQQVQRTFSVGKAALAITANDRQKFYSQPVTFGTTGFTPSGLVGSDSVSGVTLTSAGAAASAVSGNYPIVPSQAVAGPNTDLVGNYTITYNSGTLHVISAGIVGLNGVSVKTKRGKIDSFDSSAGAYGQSNHGSAAVVVGNGPLSFAGVAVFGSATSTQGSVSVARTASVSGDVTAGSKASTPGHVGGTVSQRSPSSPLSGLVSACSSYSAKQGISGGKFTYSVRTGDLTVKSRTVRLAQRTYCFRNVTLAARSTLSVSGPVTIHLAGELTGTGHLVNTTDRPGNLRIYSSFSGSNGLVITGDSHAAMKILAPRTTVTIAGGSFFGTLFAGAVKLTGPTVIHADTH